MQILGLLACGYLGTAVLNVSYLPVDTMYISEESSYSTAAKISALSVPVFIGTALHLNATFVLLPPNFVSDYSNVSRLFVLVVRCFC